MDPLIGMQIGNYLIQDSLGQGGMARVYKGLDITLKRPVAIKVIEDNIQASGTLAQRFAREAEAVANLHHPNIVSVYYFGNQSNLFYLVMEYIDGSDLDAVLRNYSTNNELMPYADVIGILDVIASALDYAHAQGVIHRDVKPSNMMIESTGRPILTDFGLALRVSEGTIGETFGTPHYISPEQARNSAQAVPQSDIYSLGVVAYEMLTGAVPFDDPSPTALAIQHMMAAVPSPRVFNSLLSNDIERVLYKVLSKEPGERYQTAKEFVADLRQSLEAMLRTPSYAHEVGTETNPDGDATATRRLSMQSALDKVNQELAMQAAKGQAVTRTPDSSLSDTAGKLLSSVNESSWLPYLVAISVAVLALVVVGLVVTGGLSGLTETTAAPTDAPAAEAAVLATTEPTSIPLTATTNPVSVAASSTIESQPPTPTALPVIEIVQSPTNTSIPPTETPAPPAVPTLLPPTEPIIAPTSAPTLPPTDAPTSLPTEPPVLPTATSGPTSAPSDWLPVQFIYTNDSFHWLNNSGRSISSRAIIFERINGAGRFEGNRWAYWTMEAGRCMEIAFADVRNPPRPNGCRPNAFFTPTRTQGIDFWSGGGQFRVLWNGQEIAVCESLLGFCNAFVPPQ